MSIVIIKAIVQKVGDIYFIESYIVIVVKMSEECLELQQEEAEVLTSIYDGDPAFVTVKAGEKYQYKLGDTEAETGLVTK